MQIIARPGACLGLVLFLPSAAAAQPAVATRPPSSAGICQVKIEPDRKSPFGLGVYFEQDGVLPWLRPWNQDRNYTMGLAFPAMGQWIHTARLDILLRGVDCLTGINQSHNRQVEAGDVVQDFSIVFGQTAFTPDAIELDTIITDDRPYASLLFLTTVRTTVNPNERRVLRSELTIGVLGLRIGEYVQTEIHQWNRSRQPPGTLEPFDPKGWPHQISDGGEPTAKYTVTLARAASESMWHDLSWHGEASAGYYTNVAGGALVRAGRLRSPFWALSTNPVSAANQRLERGIDLDEARARRRWELAGFGAARMRLVGYNALLQGQFRDSDFELKATEISRVVLEGEIGGTAGAGPCSIVATVGRRSAEYTIGVPRAHTFGGVHVVCAGRRESRRP